LKAQPWALRPPGLPGVSHRYSTIGAVLEAPRPAASWHGPEVNPEGLDMSGDV